MKELRGHFEQAGGLPRGRAHPRRRTPLENWNASWPTDVREDCQ